MKFLVAQTNYTFNAAAKTITFSGTVPAGIANILHVTNVTRGVMYFQPQGGLALSGTYASPVLTLNASTTGHANGDVLEIFLEDGTTVQPVSITDGTTPTSFGPITTSNASLFGSLDASNQQVLFLQLSGNWVGAVLLQASNDGVTWWDANGLSQSNELTGYTNAIYAPDVVTVPVVARFMRAVTSTDFGGTVSGFISLRRIASPEIITKSVLLGVDTAVQMPVVGVDPTGMFKNVAVSDTGQVVPPDNRTVTAVRQAAGTLVQLDTTGYNSVSVALFGTFAGTVTFQVSNDLSNWQAVGGWPVAGAATPVTTATAAGQWLFPAAGRFFRAQITTYTSGAFTSAVTLKNQPAFFPASSLAIAANQTVNVAQIASTAAVTAGVAGMLAVGGNVAVGAAPTANPIALAWDGTNTRRILTDASSGGVVLGSSTVTNGQTLARLSQTVVTPAATQIKASAGRLTMLTIANGAAVAGYLHLYNAAAVTLGTTTDVHVYAVPAAVDSSTIILPDGGLFFSTGIAAAFTAGVAANDNTAFGSAPTLVANYAFI